MTRQQAIATLKQGLKALFPYADPKDDPDRGRAADQKRLTEALATLSKPNLTEMFGLPPHSVEIDWPEHRLVVHTSTDSGDQTLTFSHPDLMRQWVKDRMAEGYTFKIK